MKFLEEFLWISCINHHYSCLRSKALSIANRFAFSFTPAKSNGTNKNKGEYLQTFLEQFLGDFVEEFSKVNIFQGGMFILFSGKINK